LDISKGTLHLAGIDAGDDLHVAPRGRDECADRVERQHQRQSYGRSQHPGDRQQENCERQRAAGDVLGRGRVASP
jgi:hypothetical protein